MADWVYHVNREILVNEQFGWIPHCAPYRERSRTLLQKNPVQILDVNGNPAKTGSTDVSLESSYMLDRANADRRHNADNGANFTLRKSTRRFSPRSVMLKGSSGLFYEGPLFLSYTYDVSNNQPISFSAPSIISEGSLAATGATLVSQALPTTPQVDIGVGLTELLREGLPRATLNTFRSLKGMGRGAADDFLNYQFGWKPLLSDISDFSKVLSERTRLLEQFARDSGKPVRRRRSLPTTTSTTVTKTFNGAFADPGSSILPFSVDNYARPGPGTLTQTETTETWFAGSFVYQFPVGSSTLDKLRQFERQSNYLFGLSLTPELLWEIAPWSWLVDWFTNVGDVFSNITAMKQYGTVMPYGYVMKRVTRRYQWRGSITLTPGTTWIRPGGGVGISEFDLTYVHMYRRKANPYGFGVTWESLNATQLAILAALGMTRGNRSD